MSADDLADLIAQAEADGDWTTARRLKVAAFTERRPDTDANGRHRPPVVDEPAAPTGLVEGYQADHAAAVAAGDLERAEAIATVLERHLPPGVTGSPGASAGDADQGMRTPLPSQSDMDVAIATAERAGEWTDSRQLKLIQAAVRSENGDLPNPHRLTPPENPNATEES